MNILKDSSFYQVLLKEAKEIGEQEGRIKELVGAIIRAGQIRFGRLPRAARAAIEAIDDLDWFRHLHDRVLTAKSWEDLLAEKRGR